MWSVRRAVPLLECGEFSGSGVDGNDANPENAIESEPMSIPANIDDKLHAMGLTLPQVPAPGGNYASARRSGNLVYLAGVISADAGGVMSGTVGQERTVEDGYAAARACALTQLAVLRNELGTLNAIEQVLTLNGYVNAVLGFPDSPTVINGASDLLVELLGEAGRHARAAVGVCALPRNAMVEVQMVVCVAPEKMRTGAAS